MPVLHGWETFYSVVGPSAGALIGLQFILITLIAMNPIPGDAQAGHAFGTPTVVHFAAVLLLSAVAVAPMESPVVLAWIVGFVGFGGVVYSAIVVRRMRSQNSYEPVLEDWFFHVLLPLAGYALLAAAACALSSHAVASAFAVGIAALLLLFVGLRNAWDSVTYYVFVSRGRGDPPRPRQ
jgi:hypothetical protein